MLVGIREPELLDLADALLQAASQADDLDLDLTQATTKSGLMATDAMVAVREIASDATGIANHLRWIHDELSTFRIDHYLVQTPVALAAAQGVAMGSASAREMRFAVADALWESQSIRPPVETATRDDLAPVAATVAAELLNPQRQAIAMAMIYSGVAPTLAIRAAQTVPLNGPNATSGIDHHLIASQVLIEYAGTELTDPRYGDLYHDRLDLDTSPDGRPAMAAVALAQFTNISVADAAGQIAAVITRAPWNDEGSGQVYTSGENVRTILIQEWLDVLIEAPADARPIDLSALLLERVPDASLPVAIGLVMMAEDPLRVDFDPQDAEAIVEFTAIAPTEVADSVAEYAHDLRAEINAIASTAGLLSGLLDPPALRVAIGGAARYVNMSLMIEAWVDGDTGQLTEMLTDSLAPAVARFVISRFLPALAGPFGFFLTAVLIVTTSEGPNNNQPHRSPTYAHGEYNQLGQLIQNVNYSMNNGVPETVLNGGSTSSFDRSTLAERPDLYDLLRRAGGRRNLIM